MRRVQFLQVSSQTQSKAADRTECTLLPFLLVGSFKGREGRRGRGKEETQALKISLTLCKFRNLVYPKTE